MDANSPLLFFDSGVGGLSVLEPTRALLPNAPIVYVADNAGYPYGKRSEKEIASRVPALLGRLVERFHPRLAVIACNTASTIALDHVRSALDLPVVGTVPAIKPAAQISRSRTIGVFPISSRGPAATWEGRGMKRRDGLGEARRPAMIGTSSEAVKACAAARMKPPRDSGTFPRC